MKLNFPLLDHSISLKAWTILTIESSSLFGNFVRELYHYSDECEVKFFDHKMVRLKETELMLITDVLGFDVNAPAILKLIHADLENQFNEKPEVKSMVEKLSETITELISFECLENELDLEYDEITILELIKALGVKIETQSDTFFNKCFEILQVFCYLSKKRLLVFVNIGSYLSKSELEQIFEYIALSQLQVMFIEPRQLYDFPQYVLDDDYFLIEQNML